MLAKFSIFCQILIFPGLICGCQTQQTIIGMNRKNYADYIKYPQENISKLRIAKFIYFFVKKLQILKKNQVFYLTPLFKNWKLILF